MNFLKNKYVADFLVQVTAWLGIQWRNNLILESWIRQNLCLVFEIDAVAWPGTCTCASWVTVQDYVFFSIQLHTCNATLHAEAEMGTSKLLRQTNKMLRFLIQGEYHLSQALYAMDYLHFSKQYSEIIRSRWALLWWNMPWECLHVHVLEINQVSCNSDKYGNTFWKILSEPSGKRKWCLLTVQEYSAWMGYWSTLRNFPTWVH